MRTDERTSRHLMLAIIATVFSSVLNFVTTSLDWELWVIPLIVVGCVSIWILHIARIGTDALYENLCAGLLLFEYFFFCIHENTLFDIPATTGILVFSLFILNKKWILYVTVALYALAMLYHALILHTISTNMEFQDMLRLGLGMLVVFGGSMMVTYWISKRTIQRKWYENILAELKTVEKQNAVFLSNVSHELRTPINMVIGISEVALGKDPSPSIRSDLISIEMAGKRLSHQIDNMMDYTEIVDGTMTAAKEEYMITSVLNDVITTAALQTNRQHLEMVFDIDPKLPAVLIGDAEKISHVLKILVENSIKFTEEGGLNVRIGYRQETYGINLIVDIYDTGIGMTDVQLTKMYDDFYQADTGTTRFANGLGLGIPIAKGLLNAMGGFIHFDSKNQQGLHAHIVIPQGVVDKRPCIVLEHADQLCIGCYFNPEKYVCDEIRDYYDGLILNLIKGFNIQGYQAHNFDGLLQLQRNHALSHIFIAQPEYEENSSYYEKLAETLPVIIIAEREFVLNSGSKLLVIHKPFSALSVANLLNGEKGERGFAEYQAAGRKPFVCLGVNALAVDDEEMNLVVAKGVLGSYGIEVDTCLSGREAVEKCENYTYDIIFLDHMMPGFDGVETLKKIRELNNGMYRDLPVIALTANTVSGAREMFRSEGFTEFVPKPIDRTVLERVLRKVLPKSSIQYSINDANQEMFENSGNELVVPKQKPSVAADKVQSEPVDNAPVKPAEIVDDVKPEAAVALEPSYYDRLAQAGINTQLGLDYCAGEDDFYMEMIQIFCAQSEQKRAEIASLYEEENWADYATKVHALKSTSLTIGAEALSAQSKELELAGKRGDVDYIRAHHSDLMRAYADLCANIAP